PLAVIGDRSVRLVPWSNAWTCLLPHLSLTRNTDMVFMIRDLRTPSPGKPPRSHHSVRQVETAEDMTVFADVQARAFLGPSHPEFAWWHAFMQRKAQDNLHNSRQRFFLAYYDAEAVGTLLSVYTNSVVVLYAIATLPEHRRRGVCTAL